MRKYTPRQYQTNSVFGLGSLESQQCKIKKQYSQNVDEFILRYGNQGQQAEMFKRILQEKVKKMYDDISSENTSSLWESFTFIMNPLLFPKYLRVLLFTIYNEGSFNQKYIKAALSAPDELINQTAYTAVFQSLKYGQIYLNQSVRQFKKDELYITNPGRTGWFSNFGSKFKELFGGGDFKQFQKFKGTVQKLRVYGAFAFDCEHIQQCGTRQYVDGNVLFALISAPNLRFRITNGNLIVYQFKNNMLVQIPQVDFNSNYLKSIQKTLVAKSSGYLISTFNDYVGGKIKQNPLRHKFTKKYLRQAPSGTYQTLKKKIGTNLFGDDNQI